MYLWAFFIAALKFHQSNEQSQIELQISRDRIKMSEKKTLKKISILHSHWFCAFPSISVVALGEARAPRITF